MRAMVSERYGPPEVLQLREVAKPAPLPGEVLIRVRATAVTMSDVYLRSSQVPWHLWLPMRLAIGLTRPRRAIQGLVLAGEVEAAGAGVRRFRPGDAVYGLAGFSLGAYAEYVCLPERDSRRGCLGHMPRNLGFEEATAVAYGGLLALQFLEKGGLSRGQRVLVYGASGTAGTLAVQIARARGARVTAVCSGGNQELVRSLGAETVLDYTRQEALPADQRFDLVLDAAGKAKGSRLKQACRRALAPGGRYVSIDDEALALDSGRLRALSALVEAGQVRPVLDRCFPLERLAEAHAYVVQGHKRGGVAVTMAAEVTGT